MARIGEKILLSVGVIVFLGLGAAFLSAQLQENSNEAAVAGKERQTAAVQQITKEQAKQIAQNAVKGEIINIELDNDEWFPAYEIEMQNEDGVTELEINARTGEIIAWETEDEADENIPVEDVITAGGRVTQDEAVKIALQNVPGEVLSVGAEQENGFLLYEIEIQKGSDIAEVEIDAATGEVMEIEWNED